VIDGRSRSRLLFKALDRSTIPGDLIGQNLERHFAPELEVFGTIHNAHTAPAQLFDDTIVRNGLSDHGV
jgi:hypothetical protein